MSFSQAAASMTAIIGAFGVVFCQNGLEIKRRRIDERVAAWRTLRLSALLAGSAEQRVKGIGGARSREGFHETPEMRLSEKQRLSDILAELEEIALSTIPTIEAIEYFLKVKRLIREALAEIDKCPIANAPTECGGKYGQPWIRLWNELREAVGVLRWHTKQFGSGKREPRVVYVDDF
ncbi:hypothetical protein ACXKTX_20405 [Burkholderia gladioli]